MKTLDNMDRPLRGAILFMGKFGATRQYAEWIAEATKLPLFDLDKEEPDFTKYDFYILGSSIYIGQLYLRNWLKEHWDIMKKKPALLFSVSGSPAGHPDLEQALDVSLTPEMREKLDYVPLRGRLILQDLPWYLRWMLKFASRLQKEEEAAHRMRYGFDYVERRNIEPILEWEKEQMAVVLN